MRTIKAKIILALCLLMSLLILQSYLFNVSQKSIFRLQKAQHNALMQSESVTRLEKDVISLQSQVFNFLERGSKNSKDKFNFYLDEANQNLKELQNHQLKHSPQYQDLLLRLDGYLKNYQETFEQIAINKTKREQLYTTQFKHPIDALKTQITQLENTTLNNAVYTDILLVISSLEHATISYLYQSNFDDALNVKNNINFLNSKLAKLSSENNTFTHNTSNLKHAYQQLILLTRSYTFSINVVLTGVENELLYVTNQIKEIEKNKLLNTEQQLGARLAQNTQRANLLAVLMTVIIILVSYFIFRAVIKPINQLTRLLKDMSNEKHVILTNDYHSQTEIASATKAANALYLKNKQTKDLLIETQTLNVKMAAMNKELTIAITEAESANKVKSDFVANMSHELRTPMNGVLGMLQLLKDSSLEEKQQHYADKAFSSAYNLLHLLNNILDFAKLESEKIKVEEIRFTLDSVVTNTSNLFKDAANQKGLELEFNIHTDVNLQLIGDPLHLNQVINNCVGNAIKFTEFGYVKLTIETISQQQNTIDIRFCIEDTGIGIESEQLNKIFNSFYQGDASITRKYGGTGLGLAISKQFVKVLGGHIQVRSEKHKGSEFYFTLPFKLPPQQKLKKRALLITPKKERVTQLISILKNADINPEITQEPLRALAKISQPNAPFDIVILCLNEEGLENSIILQKINEASQVNNIKIIVIVTDSHNPQLSILHNNVHIVDANYSTTAILKLLPANTGAITQSKHNNFIKFTGHKALIVDDNPLNIDITAAMLEKLDIAIMTASNGKEAIDRVDENEFDIIFMDIQMPIMDGILATKKIRETNKKMPIIALTAAVFPEDKKATISAGMDDFLTKPIIFEILYEKVKKYLLSGKSKVIMNMPLALENLEQNQPLLNKLLSQFTTDHEHFIVTFKSLFDTNNTIEMARSIHSLKGLAGTLGLEVLEQLAKEIESQINNNEPISFSQLKEKLIITLQAIKQYLLTHQSNKIEASSNLNDLDDVLKRIYELAENSKPISDNLTNNLCDLPFAPPHPLLGLKSAINQFNYKLVIELINQYRNEG